MKRIINIVAVISLFLAHPLAAQKQTPPAGGKAKDFKLSAKTKQKLPNGLGTTYVQYGTLPKVNVSLIIKTGNMHESSNQVWLADLTGEMLREGTAKMDFAEISKKAAMMGGNLNVSVGVNQTTISGSVLSEFAPDFIKLISEVVQQPSFPESEIERLKSNLKRNLATQKQDPQAQAEEKFYQAIYKDHPYGKYFPTEEMLNSYKLQDVKKFYQDNYGAKRSVLYVVGKFDETAVKTAVNNSFSKWKAGPAVNFPKVTTASITDTIMLDRKGSPQTTIMVGLPVATPNDKDYVPMLVANSLLGGSFGSRITSNIRENKGYTYSPYSSISNKLGSTLWYEAADVTTEHTVASLNEIEKEIKRLQMEPPSKDELQGIQNYEAGIFVLRNSTPGGIIGQLNFLDLYGLDDSFLTNLVKNIHSVTPEQVSEITKKHIQYDKMVKVMVGDTELIKQQVEKQKAAKKTF